MKHIVTCRGCKEKFDLSALSEDEWTTSATNWYWHKKCYDKKIALNSKMKEQTNDVECTEADWLDLLWFYLKKDLKIEANFVVIKKQWDKYIKKGYTPKGIYFCVRYIYDVKKIRSDKSNGAIGLVDWVYVESSEYWKSREYQFKVICAELEQQMKQKRQVQSQAKTIARTMSKSKKPKLIDLQDIFKED